MLLMSMLFSPGLAALTLVPWALVMGLAGYRVGGRPSWRAAFRDTGKDGKGGGASSGWTMGNTNSGGSSSGLSGGSSSSFGGGSSGGGGASGKW